MFQFGKNDPSYPVISKTNDVIKGIVMAGIGLENRINTSSQFPIEKLLNFGGFDPTYSINNCKLV